MIEEKKFVIDFVEGRVKIELFLEELDRNNALYEWIQSIVPKGKIGYYDVKKNPEGSISQEVGPYDIRKMIHFLRYGKGATPLGRIYNIHSEVSRLVLGAFPNENIQVDQSIKNKFIFLLDVCPNYIGGNEVEQAGILEELYNNLPENASKTKRIKLFSTELKKMFHVEKNHYPRWIQEAEWPILNGKPMQFLYQKQIEKTTMFTQYYFEDADTKERRIVEQFT